MLAVPAAQSQSAPPPTQFNLQLQVPLVVEDVVVLDSHNQPVHGLTAADFTVTDDGKAITPRNFEEHAASAPVPQPAVEQTALPALPTQSVNLFTNRNAVPTSAPLNILLLDALNTPMTDQVSVRRQMLKFLTTLPPGVPIAIYGLSSKLYLLQGFTSDPALLKAPIIAKGSGAQASPLLDNPVSGAPGLEQEGLDELGLLLQVKEQNDQLLAMQQFVQGDVATAQETQRTLRTLAAMGQLARYLSVLPGRKNLIWFSTAFPLDIAPDPTMPDPLRNQAHFGDVVREADDQLRRSQVAIYPVDARGLFTNPASDASVPTTHNGALLSQQQREAKMGGATGGFAGGSGASVPSVGDEGFLSQPADEQSTFANQTATEHQTMDQMAQETGGKAFYNTADLKAAVQSAIALGSNYYSLSYTPPSGKWDSKFHKIDVTVNQPDLHLTYRRAYFADDPASEDHGHPAAQASAMQAAMLHGAPDPDGLVFSVDVTPAGATTDQLSPGSRPDPKLMQPPYRTYTLDAHLDIHTLNMTTNAVGAYEGTIEFAMVVYDADGNVVNQGSRIGHVVLPPDRYAQVLAHGLSIRQSIDVPAKGTYFLRVGFHDPASDRVGAVEIPVAALKPAQAVAQSAGQNPPGQQ